MREQDKALFLQLIKLNSTIKEIRNQMKFIEESYDSSIESIDSAASYWCKFLNLNVLMKESYFYWNWFRLKIMRSWLPSPLYQSSGVV